MALKQRPFVLRICAMLMCGLCAAAFVPSLVLAYFGAGWLDIDPPAEWSAAAMVAAPVPLGLGAFFGGKAARREEGRSLLHSVACLLVAAALYAVTLSWGGRMLL